MIMDVRIQENRTGKSRQEKGHNDNRCCGGAKVNHFRLLSPKKLSQAEFHREAQFGIRPEYTAISGEGAFSENIHKRQIQRKTIPPSQSTKEDWLYAFRGWIYVYLANKNFIRLVHNVVE